MAQTINTNIASLNAQRNLNVSQTALATSLQRLSSGLRINSAKDDAAGMAITERFSTQIRGLNQATRNANDGISLAQTGEGALSSVTDNLQRIRELAVQSANSTNSDADRIAIDLEVSQRLAEIDRTASQTSFNGTKLLDGSFTSANFQIGANAGEVISVTVDGNTRLSATGKIASATTGVLGATAVAGHIDVTTADLSYLGTGSAATAGGVTLTSAVWNYGTAGQLQQDGTSTAQTILNGYDFSIAGSSLDPGTNAQTIAGRNVQTGVVAADIVGVTDYSGVNSLDFTVDTVDTVSLDSATGYADAAAVLADINGQLTTSTASFNAAGNLTFTRNAGAGSSAAIAVSGVVALDDAETLGFANSAGTSALNFTGANLAQFDVAGQGVTLNTTFASEAALAENIEGQLTGITVAGGVAGSGTLTFTYTGSTTPVAITASDANAVLSGIADSAGTPGSPAVANTNATMRIDGTLITLDSANADYEDMLSDFNAALVTAAIDDDYSAALNGSNQIVVTKDGSTDAVEITEANPYALIAGFTNSVGVEGSAAVTTTNAALTIDGHPITLDGNYGNAANLASAIDTKLGAGTYDVSVTGNDIRIARHSTGSTSTAVNVTAGNLLAQGGLGLNGAGAKDGAGGADAGTNNNATFYVDGNLVTLDQDYGSLAALATDIGGIGGQLTALGYAAVATADGVSITKTGSSAAVDITGADVNATDAGFGFASGVAGTAAGSVTVAAGTKINGIAINGVHASASALATLINSSVGGVYASVDADTNEMTLASAAAIELTGGSVGTLAAGTVAATSGSLASATVATAADANTTIMRVDAAMLTVSNLRSTFGAIQNRFESVISSLTATSENLTSARSRIQDADFAQETAALTRNQILQQAGIAMLAQANSLPQSVLSLLK